MPTVYQICAVLITVAFLVIVFAAVRLFRRLERTIEEVQLMLPDVQRSLARVDALADEARAAIAPLKELTPVMRRLSGRFEQLGERTAAVASIAIDNIEIPVFTAARVVRGLRAGAAAMYQRWTNGSLQSHASLDGGTRHE